MKLRIGATAIFGIWIGLCHTAVQGQQAPAQTQEPVTLTAISAHSVWDGVYTKEQATRGEALYTKSCTVCHGATLEGAEFVPALTGLDFGANWNGLSLGDLYDRIRTTMPQDDPAKATAQEKIDILAYVLSYSKFPAGMTELPRDPQVLSQIKYQTTKP